MPPLEPVPFSIRVPGEDVIDFKGIRSVSYRVEGLLHLANDMLEFEWTATEKTDRVSVTGIGTVVDRSPIGRLKLPVGWVAEVELRGRWLPRVRFRARRLDAFEDMPGATAGTLTLKIRRRYRRQAAALIAAIELARAATPLPPPETLTELEAGDKPPPRDMW